MTKTHGVMPTREEFEWLWETADANGELRDGVFHFGNCKRMGVFHFGNCKFAPETRVVNIAPLTITDTDTVSIPEITVLGPTAKSFHAISHKVSEPVTCHQHELVQGGSPTARFVKVCG
jgi:hypothetical protein